MYEQNNMSGAQWGQALEEEWLNQGEFQVITLGNQCLQVITNQMQTSYTLV